MIWQIEIIDVISDVARFNVILTARNIVQRAVVDLNPRSMNAWHDLVEELNGRYMLSAIFISGAV